MAMIPTAQGTSGHAVADGRMEHLDMIRGLAAVAVVLGHMRAFFMVDYAQTSHSLAIRGIYLLSGLHHQAVMVFFVLSGFLVGGSVVRQCRGGRFRWGPYLLRRLCRLWIVIVPALTLTVFWDVWGAQINPAAYTGLYHTQLASGPATDYDLSLSTGLGNIAFLQTILVPSFGSNGPLWSLANEFWYYILFPLAAPLALGGGSWRRRVAGALLATGVMIVLPREIVLLGIVWLFGVAAFVLVDHPALAGITARGWAGLAGLAVLAAFLVYSRAYPGQFDDFIIGALFAATLPWLARGRTGFGWYRKVGFALSEMSYTLYLVHFPLLAWIYFVFFAPVQWAPSASSFAMLALILVGVLAYAGSIWWLFERNTPIVRRWIEQHLRFGAPATPPRNHAHREG